MQAFIIDDGTMDTVVQIIAQGATFIQRFDSDYRYSFDSDPDISTDYFLEEVRDEFNGSIWGERPMQDKKEDAQTINWILDDFYRKPLNGAERKAIHRLMFEREPTGTSPELTIVLNHITNVTLQDLLADYED